MLANDSRWFTVLSEESVGVGTSVDAEILVYKPLVCNQLRLPFPAACFHGFAGVLEEPLRGRLVCAAPGRSC